MACSSFALTTINNRFNRLENTSMRFSFVSISFLQYLIDFSGTFSSFMVEKNIYAQTCYSNDTG